MPDEASDPFRSITWNDIEDWAGEAALARGARYQREGRVRQLGRTPDGGLVAWVDGTATYATLVGVEEGRLRSHCTCPVETSCKHAVAVLLEYRAGVGTESVPPIAPSDTRLYLHGIVPPPDPRLRRYLETLSPDDLVDLLLALCDSYPDLRREIDDRRALSRGEVSELVRSLLAEIEALTQQPAPGKLPGRGISTSDWSDVERRLRTLLERGHMDEVVGAGRVLLDKGMDLIEQSDDEGELADALIGCFDVVFEALPRSSLPVHEQMLFAVEADLCDDYGLGLGEGFWKQTHPREEWGRLADLLVVRVSGYGSRAVADRITARLDLDRLVEWAVESLDRAGRPEEATEICRSTLEATDGYPRFVRRLLKAGRRDEAAAWIDRGVRATEARYPGITHELTTILRTLREEQGDLDAVLALQAVAFFREPSWATYRALLDVGERLGLLVEVRRHAQQYLIDGTTPTPCGERGAVLLADAAREAEGRSRRIPVPHAALLVDIAIAERDPDAVLRWYHVIRQEQNPFRDPPSLKGRVADAVVYRYPDVALELWEAMAEALVRQATPQAYDGAITVLGKVRTLLATRGDEKAWRETVAGLRQVHARKRRFLERLDALERRGG